jgi:hypothetical protein
MRMSHALSLLVLAGSVSVGSASWAACVDPPGDLDANGDPNVVDVQCAILVSLWTLSGSIPDASPGCAGASPLERADMNCDGQGNVVDVQIAIQYALDQALDPAIDANADACPDACQNTACCEAGTVPGCLDETCEACVCLLDPYCCEDAWDAICVDVALIGCEVECGCGAAGAPCCAVHGGAGCDEPLCEACVCEGDAFCCDVQWDAACVVVGSSGCAAACGCAAPGDCCVGGEAPGCADAGCSDCVCALDPSCCAALWDAQCAEAAAAACSVACGCPGDCCLATDGVPGCGALGCEACVCGVDPFCCETSYDPACVAVAYGACAAPCQCPPVVSGDCCDDHGAPGCDDEGCEACVCAGDPLCCATAWDALCADAASGACLGSCGCVPPYTGCCASHPDPGCDDGACESCVCAADPTCCEVAWDASCLEEALEGCATSCGCPPVGSCCAENPVGSPGCDDGVCQACVCALDSFCCDASWDSVCAMTSFSANCEASCACTVVPGNCCVETPAAGCAVAGCEACVCALDALCCESAWDAICVEFAGSSCQGDCVCPIPGPCCESNATAGSGCTEPACEGCVCGLDPFCCDTQWDAVCVQVGQDECFADCGCVAPPGDCCAPGPGAGCVLGACEACVCGADPVCCEVQWDAGCASEAKSTCLPDCGCSVPGACCGGSPTGAPGCIDAACEACVCAKDTFCCNTAWDGTCALEAAVECSEVCFCQADCCHPTAAVPGCALAPCEACVCASDPACCDVAWDDACVAAATASCQEACQCPTPSACCEANPTGGAGCDEPGCEACVCAVDGFCCSAAWDEVCASAALGVCDPACGCPPPKGDCCTATPEAAGCTSAPCQSCVCALDPTCCDLVWDVGCVQITDEACAQTCGCPGTAQDCCANNPLGSPGCADAICEDCVCTLDSYCCATSWDLLCASEAAEQCPEACACE